MKRSLFLGLLLILFPVLLSAQVSLFFQANKADEQRDVDKAMSLYRQAIEKGDHVWQSWNNLAVHYRNKGDLTNALACVNNAMQAKPNQSNLYMTLGSIYKEGKQYDDARAAFTKAKELGKKAADNAIQQLDSMEKTKSN
jgi:tetratricopeptide (TPR) repeat protein